MGNTCCHSPHCHSDYHCDSEPVYCNTNPTPSNYQNMYSQPAPIHPLSFPPSFQPMPFPMPPGPHPMPPGPYPPIFPQPQLFNTPAPGPPPRY